MSLVHFDLAKCKRDGLCTQVCPLENLTLREEGPQEVEGGACVECGHCVAICPQGAIRNERLPGGWSESVPKQLPSAEALRGLLLSRRSMRHFQDRPLEKEVLTKLLDTARHAPTAGNSQQVHWTVCAEPTAIKSLAGLTMDWLRKAGGLERFVTAWDQGRDVVLRGAPGLVVTSCPQDYGLGSTDCAIALTYLELAAITSGLGVCWAGLFMMAAQKHEPLLARLQLPPGHRVQGALMLGYPKFRYSFIPPRKQTQLHWI